MSLTAFFLLIFAAAAQAQNCSKPVGGANMNLKGNAILRDMFEDGSRVYFSCSVGYTAAGGSPSITCSAGNWSRVTLVCERFNCGALPEVDHGVIDYPQGSEFGNRAVITCNTGYNLVGNKENRCGNQGWMDRSPVCEAVTCSPPADVENGHYGPQKQVYMFSDAVMFYCNKGLILNGPAQVKCSENGTLSPAPPTCVRVGCNDPVIPNAEFVSGSRPPHKHWATVEYRCKPGYKMTGSSTLKCEINSRWSPGIPECREIIIPPTPTTTIATTATIKTPPDDGHNDKSWKTVLYVVAVLVVVAGVISYCTGVPAFLWKKKGAAQRNKGAAEDEEEVVLSPCKLLSHVEPTTTGCKQTSQSEEGSPDQPVNAHSGADLLP